jgi:predicted PurR-regulated permease PerM
MGSSGSITPKGRLINWWDTLSSSSRLLAIALAAPLLVLNVWAFSTIFSYFRSLVVTLLVASLLSFLLNYPVGWLEQRGVKRGQAALLVFTVALLLLLVLGVTLVPLAFTQAQQLVARLPEWFDSGQRQLMMLDDRIENLGFPISLDGLITQINDRLRAQLQLFAGRILNLTLDVAVFTAAKLLDVLLTVILTFYLLLHGREVWHSLIGWLPDRLQKPFSKTLRLSFQNYFIGQIITAICMASGLISIFLLLKVPFGLLFGLTIGTMALVPFGGSVGIGLVTFLVALRDIRTAVQVVAAALVVQQIVENGVAPRVLGSVTGLNPFWVFIAILAGARVGGLLGVIVAVPTAVVIKEVLVAIRTRQTETTSSVAIEHEASDAAEASADLASEPEAEETPVGN